MYTSKCIHRDAIKSGVGGTRMPYHPPAEVRVVMLEQFRKTARAESTARTAQSLIFRQSNRLARSARPAMFPLTQLRVSFCAEEAPSQHGQETAEHVSAHRFPFHRVSEWQLSLLGSPSKHGLLWLTKQSRHLLQSRDDVMAALESVSFDREWPVAHSLGATCCIWALYL